MILTYTHAISIKQFNRNIYLSLMQMIHISIPSHQMVHRTPVRDHPSHRGADSDPGGAGGGPRGGLRGA